MQNLTLFSFRLAFVIAQFSVLTQIKRDLYHYARWIFLANGCDHQLSAFILYRRCFEVWEQCPDSSAASYSQTYVSKYADHDCLDYIPTSQLNEGNWHGGRELICN